MDPKLIAVLRTLLKLDEKSLPDSMTPEQFGEFVEKQKGKLFGNPEDIKNLQKLITAKDVDLKKALEAVEKLDPKKKQDPKDPPPNPEIDKLTEQVKGLADIISTMTNANEVKDLKKAFPDIAPELLVGKKKEDVEKIVDKQRNITKRLYGDSARFKLPNYQNEEEIDKEIEEIKKDDKIGGENAAVEVLKLGREKTNLQ